MAVAAGGIEGLANDSAFARLIAGHLRHEQFKLIDVGCAGGLSPGWRVFGDRLSALGLDANAPEIERLSQIEVNPNITYAAGWVGLPQDHPLRRHIGSKAYWHQWAGMRLAYERTLVARQGRAEGRDPLSTSSYFGQDVLGQAWATTPPGGIYDTDYAKAFERFAPAEEALCGGGPGDLPVIHLPPYLKAAGFYDADFLKLDIDGPDYEVLRSLTDLLAQPSLIGASLEISFFGSHDANDNSFHNVDRLMREKGFDLFSLSVRTYSSAALPFPYLATEPSQNSGGRPGQGDAVYIRDLGSRVRRAEAAAVSDEALAKTAALFALAGLPDYAAEMLIVHRERLSSVIDVDQALDVLAAEMQPDEIIAEGYHAYIAAFDADDPRFFNRGSRILSGPPHVEVAAPLATPDDVLAETQAALEALAQSQAVILAMTRSSSWRLTAPLRWLATLLKGRRPTPI